jgi:ubiquinone/menaquinone biosynthesis C-methylase UbiE
MGSASEAAWRIGIPGHHGIVQQDEEIDSRVMDFFDRQWSSYRAIVEHDLMEHRAVAAATAVTIDAWLAARPGHAPAATMVDLGCGDLALLAPLLHRLPLGRYTGLDQAGVVLPLAQAALGEVPYPTQWLEGDLQAWAQGQLDPPNATAALQSTDILHSSFAIHHLNDQAKSSFLEAARRRINPNGLFIWVDVFREPGESRTAYIERYINRIRSGWHQLNAEQQDHVISHLTSCDLPADREAITAAARAAGWQWQWAWQGAHQAEALAVLTPA